MHSNKYTLIFTAVLTIILGFFVSTADSSLKDMREKNIEADIRKNILSSLQMKFTMTQFLLETSDKNKISIYSYNKFNIGSYIGKS